MNASFASLPAAAPDLRALSFKRVPGRRGSLRLLAEQIGSFAIGSTSFKLTSGPSNDVARMPVGATFDVRVREQ